MTETHAQPETPPFPPFPPGTRSLPARRSGPDAHPGGGRQCPGPRDAEGRTDRRGVSGLHGAGRRRGPGQGRGRPARPDPPGRRHAEARRVRGLPAAQVGRADDPDSRRDDHLAAGDRGADPGHRGGRRRLPEQALQPAGADDPRAVPAEAEAAHRRAGKRRDRALQPGPQRRGQGPLHDRPLRPAGPVQRGAGEEARRVGGVPEGAASRGHPARRGQDRHPGLHPLEARAADAGGADGHAGPPRHRGADLLPAQVPAPGPAHHPPPPRALGRQRVPRRPGRRGDSPHRPHPPGGGPLRRLHHAAALQARLHARAVLRPDARRDRQGLVGRAPDGDLHRPRPGKSA